MTDHRAELAATMDRNGWDASADLIVDTTTERLCGATASDDMREATRAALWTAWRVHFSSEVWV